MLQGLCLVEIAADGHCLFSAIADQLKRRGTGESNLLFETLAVVQSRKAALSQGLFGTCQLKWLRRFLTGRRGRARF